MSKKNITRVSKKVRAKKSRHLIELFKSRVKNPEIVFLSLIIPFGLIMTLLMPIGSTPDEPEHFYRAFQVSKGIFVSENENSQTGGRVPYQIEKDMGSSLSNIWEMREFAQRNIYRKITGEKVNFKEVDFVKYPNTAVYPPIAYVPQAMGINVARIIYPTTGFMVLIAKLCNLALFIVLVWWAIRIAVYQRWVYVTLALFPIVVQQATSLSTDVMTIGGLFIFIATLHNILIDRDIINRREIWQLIISSLLIICSRPTNGVVLLPLLFIPIETTRNRTNKIKLIITIIGGSLAIAIGWYLLMKLLNYNLRVSSDINVDMSKQLKFIVLHPFVFIKALFMTFVMNTPKDTKTLVNMTDFIAQSSHSFMSWFLYKLPLWSVFLGYLTLFISFFKEDQFALKRIKLLGKKYSSTVLVGIATFAVSVISMATILYLTWTPVGYSLITGIQGRYIVGFLPLLIPLGIYLQRFIKVACKDYAIGAIVFAGSLINLLVLILLTFKWFY